MFHPWYQAFRRVSDLGLKGNQSFMVTHHFPYKQQPFLGPKSPYPGDGEGITAPLRAASFRRFNQCSLSLPRQEAWEASCGDSNHQEYDAL